MKSYTKMITKIEIIAKYVVKYLFLTLASKDISSQFMQCYNNIILFIPDTLYNFVSIFYHFTIYFNPYHNHISSIYLPDF